MDGLGSPRLRWTSLSLPELTPIPIRAPATADLPAPLVVDAARATFLMRGLGPVDDDDVRWMWRWDQDNVLHVFRSSTGREYLRLPFRSETRGWRATSVAYDGEGLSAERAVELVAAVLAETASVRGLLVAEPPDALPCLEEASVASAVEELDSHTVLRRLTMAGRALPLSRALTVASWGRDRDLLRLAFDDGTVLWMRGAATGRSGSSLVLRGSAGLLWPGRAWAFASEVRAWSAVEAPAPGSPPERARGPHGDDLDLDALASRASSGSGVQARLVTPTHEAALRRSSADRLTGDPGWIISPPAAAPGEASV